MGRATIIFWTFVLFATLLVKAKDHQHSGLSQTSVKLCSNHPSADQGSSPSDPRTHPFPWQPFFYKKQTSNMNLNRRVRDTSSPTNTELTTSTPEVLNTGTSAFKDSGSSDDPANKTDSTVAAKTETHTEITPETTKPVPSATTTTSRTDVHRDDKLFYSKLTQVEDCCGGDTDYFQVDPSWIPDPDPMMSDPDPVIPDSDPIMPDTDPMMPNSDPMMPDTDPMMPDQDPMIPDQDPMMPDPDPMMARAYPSALCTDSPSSSRYRGADYVLKGGKSIDGGSIATKIIGGMETTIEKHPYQVSIQFKSRPFCGGTILNHDTILTAAHCFEPLKRDMYRHLAIKVGATVYSNGQQYEIARIVRNKNYNRGATSNNDVAIMKLAKPLTFSNRVQPIELQPAGQPVPPGTTAIVTGWGTILARSRVIPGALRMAPLSVISNSQCQSMYRPANYWITTAMLCTSAPGRDSCQGDSGGPLVADGKLIGVVSWGIGCAEARYPGVYANVSTLHDFISKFM